MGLSPQQFGWHRNLRSERTKSQKGQRETSKKRRLYDNNQFRKKVRCRESSHEMDGPPSRMETGQRGVQADCQDAQAMRFEESDSTGNLRVVEKRPVTGRKAELMGCQE